MKVLVTGADGFVGQAIVAELSSHELILLDIKKSPAENSRHKWFESDIADGKALRELDLPEIDVLIHAAGLAHQFAGNIREAFWRANVDGTSNIAELGLKLKARHFILISSVSVYGEGKGDFPVTEDTECRPVGLYAESKYESELAARSICEKNGMGLTIFRLATVIGEGDRGNVNRLMRAIHRGRFLWIGNGENQKSLVYKSDVARACELVMEKFNSGSEVFNVSAPPETMKNIVGYISESLGKRSPKLAVPLFMLRTIFRANSSVFKVRRITALNETVDKWMSDETFSAEKFARLYDFRTETTIREAVRREAAWFLSNK